MHAFLRCPLRTLSLGLKPNQENFIVSVLSCGGTGVFKQPTFKLLAGLMEALLPSSSIWGGAPSLMSGQPSHLLASILTGLVECCPRVTCEFSQTRLCQYV